MSKAVGKAVGLINILIKREIPKDLLTCEKKRRDKIKIKYAKEFFINEKGEVIKMAAIVSKDEDVLRELRSDKYLLKEIEAFKICTNI